MNEENKDPKKVDQTSRWVGLGVVLCLLVICFIVGTHWLEPSKSTQLSQTEPAVSSQLDTNQNRQQEISAEESSSEAAQQPLIDFEQAIYHALEQAHDSVVYVSNYQKTQYQMIPYPFDGWYYDGYLEEPDYGHEVEEGELTLAAEGSGVIYKIDGNSAYLVTNNHVIEGSEEVKVTLSNGEEVEAEVVGADSLSDLAVLKIPAKGISQAIKFMNSDQIKVGSLAIAIGSPLGSAFSSSVTQGIISGVNREVPIDIDGDGRYDWIENLLQTDAAINPGNSGGALVNRQGELMGINSSKLSSVGVEGMGFAIPANLVQEIVQELEEKGGVSRPVLGVGIVEVANLDEESRTKVLGLDKDQHEGVAISAIYEGSAAAQSDLEMYDVIVGINEFEVDDYASLRSALYHYRIGETVKVKVLRQGQVKEVDVQLVDANISENLPLIPEQMN